MTCWVITDGKAGMENQCLGLAEALEADVVVKRVHLRNPWRRLSPYLHLGARFAADTGGDPIAPPWPEIAIGCGRQAIPPLIAIRQASRGRCFTIYLQDPRISARHFDLVVPPEHDRLRGPNVVTTRGALHRVTPAVLAAAAERFAPSLSALPHPRVAVLIGGSSAAYHLTPIIMGDVADRLTALAQAGAGLMVTTSRRTGADNTAILRARLDGQENVAFWDGTGENPYFAYLGLADAIVVTCDSTNMVSEACSTGKPVHVIELEGGTPKFRRFLDGLYGAGLARPFTGVLESWRYEPLNEPARIAAEVRRRMATRPGELPQTTV